MGVFNLLAILFALPFVLCFSSKAVASFAPRVKAVIPIVCGDVLSADDLAFGYASVVNDHSVLSSGEYEVVYERVRVLVKVTPFYKLRYWVNRPIGKVWRPNVHYLPQMDERPEAFKKITDELLLYWKEKGLTPMGVSQVQQSEENLEPQRTVYFTIEFSERNLGGARLYDASTAHKILTNDGGITSLESNNSDKVQLPMVRRFPQLQRAIDGQGAPLKFELGLFTSDSQLVSNTTRVTLNRVAYYLALTYGVSVEREVDLGIKKFQKLSPYEFSGSVRHPFLGGPVYAGVAPLRPEEPLKVVEKEPIQEETLRFFDENQAYIYSMAIPAAYRRWRQLGIEGFETVQIDQDLPDGLVVFRMPASAFVKQFYFDSDFEIPSWGPEGVNSPMLKKAKEEQESLIRQRIRRQIRRQERLRG